MAFTKTQILIKMLRRNAKESQQKFAEKNGVTVPRVSEWENGKYSISFNKAMEISDRYGFDVINLLKSKSKGLQSAYEFMKSNIEKK